MMDNNWDKMSGSLGYDKDEYISKLEGEVSALRNINAILKADKEALKKFLKEASYPTRRIKLFIKNNEKGCALWDADHITPVALGGGGCGLDGMRTLCLPCHDIITHDQRRIIALGISINQNILWDDNKLYSEIKND